MTTSDAAEVVPAPARGRRWWWLPVLLLVLAGALVVWIVRGGDTPSPGMARVVTSAATPAPAGSAGAVYLVVANPGAADELQRVQVPGATAVSLHRTVAGSGLMEDLSVVEVPQSGTLAMEPGGTHVMADGLAQGWAVGDTVTVEVTFRDAGPVSVDVPVVDYPDVADQLASRTDGS